MDGNVDETQALKARLKREELWENLNRAFSARNFCIRAWCDAPG
jgi:hypothetical protein